MAVLTKLRDFLFEFFGPQGVWSLRRIPKTRAEVELEEEARARTQRSIPTTRLNLDSERTRGETDG